MERDGFWKKPEQPPRASFFGVKSCNLTNRFFWAGSLLGIEVGLCTTGGGVPAHWRDFTLGIVLFQTKIVLIVSLASPVAWRNAHQSEEDLWLTNLRPPLRSALCSGCSELWESGTKEKLCRAGAALQTPSNNAAKRSQVWDHGSGAKRDNWSKRFRNVGCLVQIPATVQAERRRIGVFHQRAIV
jgi:hypothetical protein